MNENRSLEISSDGTHFQKVCYITAGGLPQQTLTIPFSTSRFFRVTFKNPVIIPDFGAIYGIGGEAPKAPLGTDIAEIVLHTNLRINRFEEKAGYAAAADLYAKTTATSDDVIAVNDVVDLSAKLKPYGALNWNPPAGKWNIVRFGYSLTLVRQNIKYISKMYKISIQLIFAGINFCLHILDLPHYLSAFLK